MDNISRLLLFAGTLMVVACSQDEVLNLQQDTPIQFRTSVERQTRAVSTSVNSLNAFNVTAWDDQAGDYLFENETYERNNDVFTASGPKRYWPKGADVYFYAYAPIASNSNGVTYNDECDIEVTPLADTDSQVDLIYASTKGNKTDNALNGVKLNFRHTMSQIEVKVKNSSPDYKFNVTGWKIAGVDGSASFQFDNLSYTDDAATGSQNTFDRSMWYGNDDDYSVSYSKTFDSRNVTDAIGSWGILGGSAILIPQSARAATAYEGSDPSSNPMNGAYIAIQYQAFDEDDSQMAPAGTWACWPVKFDWMPGFRYIYTIDLAELGYSETGKDDLDPIIEDMDIQIKFVDVTVDAWQPENDEDANRDVSMTKGVDPFLRFHTEGGVNALSVTGTSRSSETFLEYSLDEGNTWTVLEFDDPVGFGESTPGDNHDLLIRGKGFYNYVDQDGSYLEEKFFVFDDNNQLVECSGKVGGLYDYDNPDANLIYDGQYASLFYGCECLTTAPQITASNVTEECYKLMFYGCTNLVEGPKRLKARSLQDAYGCYNGMFEYCTNLISAPELPATTLSEYCYSYMFCGCTSLTDAPSELPATTLTEYCYSEMFSGCTSLVNAPQMHATTLAENCCHEMFKGCTSLINVPELPATVLVEYCYSDMFYGCTSLLNAPELPATVLAEFCYSDMFSGCTSLLNAPALPATTMERSCYYMMFDGCISLINAPALPATTMADFCYNGMFRGCKNLSNAPELPATTLATSCYQYMFAGCSSMITGPELPATSLATRCYMGMFGNCKNLTGPSALPATELAEECYHLMFTDCTSLNVAPTLPATVLRKSCYAGMFRNCSMLGTVRMYGESYYANDPGNIYSAFFYNGQLSWFSNATPAGILYVSPNVTWDKTSMGVPADWIIRTN